MIALLIIGNFVLNVIQAQVDATEEYERLFDLADVIFASIFLVELLINMFGTMVNEFVSDWWNWFDVLIVFVSVVSIFLSGSGAKAGMQLRLLRNIRGKETSQRSHCYLARDAHAARNFGKWAVLRLVKRIASLRTILEGTQELYEASAFPAALLAPREKDLDAVS